MEVAYYYSPGLEKKLAAYELDLGWESSEPSIARLGYRTEQLQWNGEALLGGDDDDAAAHHDLFNASKVPSFSLAA